jgi:hypothetical protein
MAKIKGRVKLLFDIDEILTSHELYGLDGLRNESAIPA